ncbi:MAG: hypothetical protein M3Y74_13365, partial [Chloroflexota bacterium]|nr:hypothetical protein [Chloroflexota bacterium]
AEPQFAFGHHLGRTAHDGGGTLGPRWPRYGATPELLVEEGNVFALGAWGGDIDKKLSIFAAPSGASCAGHRPCTRLDVLNMRTCCD